MSAQMFAESFQMNLMDGEQKKGESKRRIKLVSVLPSIYMTMNIMKHKYFSTHKPIKITNKL